MKYVVTLDPQAINTSDGDLWPLEETNGRKIYNKAIEQESSDKSIVSLGTWGGTSGVINCDFDTNEMCILSSGTVKLTNQYGEEYMFGPGQGFIIQAGFKGTWESIGDVRKWYVIYKTL